MPELITDEQRTAWQALADAATPGPWRVGCEGSEGSRVNRDSGDRRLDSRALLIVNGTEQPQEHRDAEFIAAARTAVPTLLAAVEAAEAELRTLRFHHVDEPAGQCPTCAGQAHHDMAGVYWHITGARAEDGASRVRELHRPIWRSQRCSRPRKGCDREDCSLVDAPGGISAKEYRHERGYRVCEHCTDTADSWSVVSDEWPCPTRRALDGGDPP